MDGPAVVAVVRRHRSEGRARAVDGEHVGRAVAVYGPVPVESIGSAGRSMALVEDEQARAVDAKAVEGNG